MEDALPRWPQVLTGPCGRLRVCWHIYIYTYMHTYIMYIYIYIYIFKCIVIENVNNNILHLCIAGGPQVTMGE